MIQIKLSSIRKSINMISLLTSYSDEHDNALVIVFQ